MPRSVVPDSPIDEQKSAESQPQPLLGQSLAMLKEWAQSHGQPSYRGQQLYSWIYQKGVKSLTDISVLPKQWRADIAHIPVGRSEIYQRVEAPDATVKFLLRLADGQVIETVGIPSDDRLTVCVSSQVGCPMGCDFCATGKGGFLRNLHTHEIIDQVLTVQDDFQQRVSNIVFMGMGEPLLNLNNVVAAVLSLNHDVGISQRTMTISSVGIPGRIQRLAEQHLQTTLAVSLHASNQALREQLIPSAHHYPLDALLDECREYVKLTGRRVTFEYVLLSKVNDEVEHAIELAHHLRGFQSHVNLIPYNPIDEVEYQRPTDKRIRRFTQVLKDHRIAVSVRYSRGLEKNAACGQLRASQAALAT